MRFAMENYGNGFTNPFQSTEIVVKIFHLSEMMVEILERSSLEGRR